MGSADLQGSLWGSDADNWATIQEPTSQPLYDDVLQQLLLVPELSLLDLGCGSGCFLQRAASSGARLAGLDASDALLALARQRLPGVNLHRGDLEALPFPDATFDVVTGFNSIQYASTPQNALHEAARVLRPGGRLVIVAWGDPALCQATGYLKALASLLPPPPPGAAGPFALSAPGALEALVQEAGFQPLHADQILVPWRYENEAVVLQGLLSAGPAIRAIRQTSRAAVEAVTRPAIAPYRQPDGRYLLTNAFRYVIAGH